MKPQDRYNWIERHMRGDNLLARGGVDILCADFVDAYIEATEAPYGAVNWGAYKCPQLGRDLAAMYRAGTLKRGRVGLSDGAWQPGFPKWVYCYRLAYVASEAPKPSKVDETIARYYESLGKEPGND